jgi:hypothetical protein
MRKTYDFSNARRGAVIHPAKGTRISIRLDDWILAWFKGQVEQAGGGNYHSLIRAALVEHVRRHVERREKVRRRARPK